MNRAASMAAIVLFLTGTASAQETVAVKKPEVRRTVDQFADCVVRRHHDSAKQFVLSTIPASNKGSRIYEPICLQVDTNLTDGMVTLRAQPQEIRFALAQALIPRDLDKFDPNKITTTPAPKQPELKELQGLDERDRAYVVLDAYSECVVRKNPLGVRDLLKTRLNGTDEQQALQTIMPALSACLDRGKQFGTDRTTLRGSLALAYYRLAVASERAQEAAE